MIFSMFEGYNWKKECTYHPKSGMIIPKYFYWVLEGRNSPPFNLYSFLRNDEFPYVELFDDFGRKSDDFPTSEEPVVLRVRSQRRILLPHQFEEALGLDDRVMVVGNRNKFELWKPEDWFRYSRLHEWAAIASEEKLEIII